MDALAFWVSMTKAFGFFKKRISTSFHHLKIHLHFQKPHLDQNSHRSPHQPEPDEVYDELDIIIRDKGALETNLDDFING